MWCVSITSAPFLQSYSSPYKAHHLDNENVRIGIEAPIEVPVMRQEIYNEISQNNQAAAGSAEAKMKIKQLVKN